MQRKKERKKKQTLNYGSCRTGLVWTSLSKTWLMVCLGLLNYLCWPCTSHVGLSSQDQAESQCPLTMSKQRDHLRSASHVTRPRRSLWRQQRHNGLLYFSNQTMFLLLQVDTLVHIAAINPDFLVCGSVKTHLCVHVCVYLAGEQGVNAAGLWQPSCPSARLIMQERRSRPRSFRLGAEPGLHASPITWPRPSLFSFLYPGKRMRATAPRTPGISCFPLFLFFCCPFFPPSVGVRR